MKNSEEIKKSIQENIKHYKNGVKHFEEIYRLLCDPRYKDEPDVEFLAEAKKIRKAARKLKSNNAPREKPPMTSKLIRQVLHEMGRPMTQSEIENRIIDLQGNEASIHKTRLPGSLGSLTKRNEIMKGSFRTSEIILYALPEWFDENRQILLKYFPSPEMINDVDENKVIQSNFNLHNKF